jgi:beta-lactamase class A
MLTWIVKPTLIILVLISGQGLAAEGGKRISSAPGIEQQLSRIAERSGGTVGVCAVHVESGQTIALSGDRRFPLYSVLKLPLAVAVLKDIEARTLRLDQKVSVRPEDIAAGAPGNTKRWEDVPKTVSIRELLEFALVDSDNTSCDKLLELIGGPAALTRRLSAIGLPEIRVEISMKEMAEHRNHLNAASPNAVAQLLATLQKGRILQPAERAVLFDMMRRARTGPNRLRAGVPAGTEVLDKTGTGSNTVNDVGLITLPGSQGHIAIAVMVTDSKLPSRDQERTIAEIAATVYNAQWYCRAR